MNIFDSFEEQAGISFLDACIEKSMKFGYFIIGQDDIDELYKDKDEFKRLYDAILSSYVKQERSIPVAKVMKAIDVSLYNSLLDTKRCHSKESWMSDYLFSDDDCIDICMKYGEFAMNPLVFMFDKDNYTKYQTILNGKKLKLVGLSVKNGNNYRHSRFFLQRAQVDRMNIDRVDKIRYHPVVWALLKEGKLDRYIELYSNRLEQGVTRKRKAGSFIPKHRMMTQG